MDLLVDQSLPYHEKKTSWIVWGGNATFNSIELWLIINMTSFMMNDIDWKTISAQVFSLLQVSTDKTDNKAKTAQLLHQQK
jgi:hypothetical protein